MIRKALQRAAGTLGYSVQRIDQPEPDISLPYLSIIRDKLDRKAKGSNDLLERRFIENIAGCLLKSRAQLFQDAFVLAALNGKRNGFFVEFGATDGVTLSNSFMLETDFAWSGILAEPARNWQQAIATNRPKAKRDSRCVWRESGQTIEFMESSRGEYSTVEEFSYSDFHGDKRSAQTTKYKVDTITLADLLVHHDAPSQVDYLSIDTEGSELEILKAFPFDERIFTAITVEHNYSESRKQLFDLLTSKGYRRVLEKWSQWDDWYILDR